MINITVLLALVWSHFVGDFILQSSYLALNKSKSNKVLLQHVLWYAIPLLVLAMYFSVSIYWVLLNVVLHFMTDYVTSRITGHLWQKEEYHWYFVTIGADQAIHLTCLITSYYYLGRVIY